MEDLPARVADFLEQIATTVRSVTVDRAAGWARMVALGIVAVVLVLMAVWFILVGIIRLLSTWIAVEYLYAIIGGLFVIAGALLWSRRTPKETT